MRNCGRWPPKPATGARCLPRFPIETGGLCSRCSGLGGDFLRPVGCQPRRTEVRLKQPGRAVGIITKQLLVFFRTQVASPDHPGAAYVGFVVDPLFLKK